MQPESAFFVWVSERGRVGQGLTNRFLPRRFQILSDYLKKWDPTFPPLGQAAPAGAMMAMAAEPAAATFAAAPAAQPAVAAKRTPLVSRTEKFATRDMVRALPGPTGETRAVH